MMPPENKLDITENEPMKDNFDFEEVEKDVFKNCTLKTPGGHGNRHAFGGLLCAQTLACADKTVPVELNCHSFQSNFILQVDTNKPVFYRVSRLFDGRSFATRYVECRQEGAIKFVALIAYQRQEAHAIEHQSEMPTVPKAEECEYFDTDWANQQAFYPHLRMHYDDANFNDPDRHRAFNTHETRCVNARKFYTTQNKTDKHCFWARYTMPIEDTHRMHYLTLLYISYTKNNIVVYNAHTRDGFVPSMSFSLSHTIYFHGRPFNANDWMLFELESTNATAGRGLTRGRIWNENGEMIASVSQEAVVRGKTSTDAKL